MIMKSKINKYPNKNIKLTNYFSGKIPDYPAKLVYAMYAIFRISVQEFDVSVIRLMILHHTGVNMLNTAFR